MQSEIKVFSRPNGEIQRVQLVRLDDWESLDFLHLPYGEGALMCFSDIYRKYLVPECPWIFGNMILFHLPEDLEVVFPFRTEKYGDLADPLTAAAAALQEGVRIFGGKPRFRDETVKAFYHALEARNCLHVVSGRLPVTQVIPVGHLPGYMTQTEPDAQLKVNANFFIMDKFDCATIYDHVGTPLGLCVKNGEVLNPPLFGREALLVGKDGTVTVTQPDIREMQIEINGKIYRHGKNAHIYSRPRRFRTPGGSGVKLVIIGCRVAAVCHGDSVAIPASGFVLCPRDACAVKPGDRVAYLGMEDVAFGIQVGNSIVRNGEKTEKFISLFYNIRHLEPIPFPPSLYPMDFNRARAARIALGADAEGKPMLLWAEGVKKHFYIPGQDSSGASLREMAEICAESGMVNAVNLDGGGSAQILLKNQRMLRISDKNPTDNADVERPVPLGLVVR